MRRLILTMLLATTMATPALAQREDRGNWRRDGGSERSRPDRGGSRAEMAAPQAQAAQPEAQAAPRVIVSRGAPRSAEQGQATVERPRGGGWNNGNGWQNGGARGNGAGFEGRATPRGVDPAMVSRWQERRARRGDGGEVPVVSPSTVAVSPNGGATRWGDHVRSVDGTSRDWTRTRDGRDGHDRRWRDGRTGDGRWQGGQHDGHRWTSDWRRDRRYDWRDYRNRNRSIFRLGRYYDPFGYGYQRLSIGFTLFSGYYQSNYWLDDPYQYRLPPVYGPYRWVRYYDDAVLVDIYTGEVVDVIEDFFW